MAMSSELVPLSPEDKLPQADYWLQIFVNDPKIAQIERSILEGYIGLISARHDFTSWRVFPYTEAAGRNLSVFELRYRDSLAEDSSMGVVGRGMIFLQACMGKNEVDEYFVNRVELLTQTVGSPERTRKDHTPEARGLLEIIREFKVPDYLTEEI